MRMKMPCVECGRTYGQRWHSREPKYKGKMICTRCYKNEYHSPIIPKDELTDFFNHRYKRKNPITQDEERFLYGQFRKIGCDENIAKERVRGLKKIVKESHKIFIATQGLLRKQPGYFKKQFDKLVEVKHR